MDSDKTHAVLQSWVAQDITRIAPHLMPFEVANALHRRVLRGELNIGDSTRMIARLLASRLAGCGKRGSLLNCPVDGLRNTTMSGYNRSLGHDYIHILGDYYACRCPQDEVDRPQ